MKKNKKKSTPRKSKPKSGARNISASTNANARNNQPYHPLISHTLIWVGSALTAFTFLGGLQTLVDFSPWASWILNNWVRIAEAFWAGPAWLLGIKIERDAIIPGTFIMSMMSMGLGAMMLDNKDVPSPSNTKKPSFWDVFLDHETSLRHCEGIAIGLAIALATLSVVNWYLFDSLFAPEDLYFWWMKWMLLVLTPVLYAYLFFQRSNGDYFHLLVLTISMALLYVLMLIPVSAAAKARGDRELWSLAFMVVNTSVFLFPSKMMTIMALARPRFWNYRMVYVWLTILLILTLDWVARNSISLRPPV